MKTLLIILLPFILYAQEVISVSRGSGSYVYTVTTDTNQIVAGDLWLYGNVQKTLTDTGSYSVKPYIVWKYTGGSYDSSIALRIGNSFLIKVLDPTLDATGTYYASCIYKTKAGNWIYSRGTDSTFTTPVTIIPPDTVPVPFAFHDSTGVEFTTVVESNGITLAGLDSAWCYAGGAEFKVNAGAWRTAGIKVYDDDVIYLRNTSSGVCTTAVNTTLAVGGIQDVFSITTKLDNTPSAFTFTDVTGAEVSTLYTSNYVQVDATNCASAISINGGQFQINSNTWRNSSTTITNADSVRVRNTSSANYNTSVTSILTIGGVQDTYTVTTRADTVPSQFTFTDVTNAQIDSLHYSNGVALASLDSCYGTAGLDTFKVGVNGSWFVGTKRVYGNDTIYLKNVSSASYSTVENMTFTAGGTSDIWSITTMADPNSGVYFTDLTNVATNSTITSDSIIISGDFDVWIHADGDNNHYNYQYNVNGGSWVNAGIANSTTVTTGDLIRVRGDVQGNGTQVMIKLMKSNPTHYYSSGAEASHIDIWTASTPTRTPQKWYLTPTGAGDYSGTSWANAASSLWQSSFGGNPLNWDLVGGGDTIFVSAGTYSAEGYSNNPMFFNNNVSDVVITKSYEAGHIGEVNFKNTVNWSSNIPITNSSHIKFFGITFEVATTTFGGAAQNNIILQYCENVYFDSCKFLSIYSANAGGFSAQNCTYTGVTNSLFVMLGGDDIRDADPVTGSEGYGAFTFTGNRIYYSTTNPSSEWHRDVFQLVEFGNVEETYTTTIANNFIWFDNPTANICAGGIYTNWESRQDYYIYGNVIIFNGLVSGLPINMGYHDANYPSSVFMLNNTFLAGGTTSGNGNCVDLENRDTTIFKNNITQVIASTQSADLVLLETATWHGNWNSMYKDFDYNFYTNVNNFQVGNPSYNWGTWNSAGYDVNGDTSHTVFFTDYTDSIYSNYYTTFGRDAGVDIYTQFPQARYDMLGTDRLGDGLPDAGGLEYIGGGLRKDIWERIRKK